MVRGFVATDQEAAHVVRKLPELPVLAMVQHSPREQGRNVPVKFQAFHARLRLPVVLAETGLRVLLRFRPIQGFPYSRMMRANIRAVSASEEPDYWEADSASFRGLPQRYIK